MKIINVKQGSPEWLEIRLEFNTASEASMMMGKSKHTSRDELLSLKHTGEEKEYSDWVKKKLFDKGHEIESLARPIAEAYIGKELFPATAINDDETILASFDGVTMFEDIIWECKSWNELKAESVRNGQVPEVDLWQVIQQLAVCPTAKCLYTVSDGTEEKTVHVFKEYNESEVKKLMAGWNLFTQDLESYVPPIVKAEPVAKEIMPLPSLSIDVTGSVNNTNIEVFEKSASQFIAEINEDLKTDQDFADAEKVVKFCDQSEKQLELVKSQALIKMTDINTLFSTVDKIKSELRTKRLSLERLVKAEKINIRNNIVSDAKKAFYQHIVSLDEGLGGQYMPVINADFPGAIKGKRNITSVTSAANDELARVKIEANEVAEAIRANLKLIESNADFKFLFNDLNQIITKDNDDFALLVNSRVEAHREAEDKRLKEEREAIRKEEEAKIAAKLEAARKKQLEEIEQEKEQAIHEGINNGSNANKKENSPVSQEASTKQPEVTTNNSNAKTAANEKRSPGSIVGNHAPAFNSEDDAEKLIRFAREISDLTAPVIASKEYKRVLGKAITELTKAHSAIIDGIESLKSNKVA